MKDFDSFFGRKNLIVELCFQFSLDLISYCKDLDTVGHFLMSKQLFRSGTSIGANVMESQDAESKADFLHKLKIAIKETNETYYWLLLCKHASQYPNPEHLLSQIVSIKKVITKIIISTRKNKHK